MRYLGRRCQRILIWGCVTAALSALMMAGALPVNAEQGAAGDATTGYTLRKISNLDGYGLTPDGKAYGYNLKTALAEVVTPSGKVTTLTTPSGDQSFATTGHGDFYAGQILTTGTAVRWTVSGSSVSAQTLTSLDGSSALAEGIDAAGAVVGQSDSVAVLWKAGSTAPTKLPLPTGYTGGEATSISADGTIIAGCVITSANVFRAATWLRGSGGAYVIHLLTGTGTEAMAINSAGIEVGGQLIDAGHATEWLPEAGGTFKAVDLGGPAADGCIATAIDNAATPAVIGDCDSSKTIYAWTYNGDQTLTDLQPVIAQADPGVTATRAMGVDSTGQFLIEAQGAAFADYVLTPSSST